MRSVFAIIPITLLALLVGSVPLSAGDPSPVRPSKGFSFVAKVCQGDPLGSIADGEVKVLGTIEGACVVNSGGGYRVLQEKVREVEGGQVVPGCVMYTNFEPAEEGKIRLRLTLVHTGLEENKAQELVIRTSYKRHDRVVQKGETVRLAFGKPTAPNTFLELRVHED